MESFEILHVILSIPFIYQIGVLWFMYMLVGLYLLAPILSPWLRQIEKRELDFYLFLWAITMCYPYIRDYVSVDESHAGILYYFGGYVGYFLLGYYLRAYQKTCTIWKCLALLMIPLLIAVFIKTQQLSIQFYDSFWYLSILVAIMSVAWFMLIKRVDIICKSSSRLHRFIALVSNCSFGIYLVHIFIMRSVVWHWTCLYSLGVMQIVLVTFLTFIGSFVLTWLIGYLPGAEYVIGFRQKR